jgi:tetratricopeptide (TPR) repeat protein
VVTRGGASLTPRAGAAAAGGAVRDRLAALAPKAGALGSAALKSAGAQRAWDGQWPQALSLYTSAAKAAPTDPDAWFGIGLCQAELGQARFAAKTVRYVLTLEPDHALAHVLAGFLAQDRGQLAEARSHYERSLALQPDGLFAAELSSVLEHLPPPPTPRGKHPAVVLGRVAMAKSGGAR